MAQLVLRGLRNGPLMAVLSPLVALMVWQLLVNIGVISLDTFTSPVRVFYALLEIITESNPALRGSLATHIWASLQEVVLGFACAAGIGVPVGLLMGWSRIARNVLDPLVESVATHSADRLGGDFAPYAGIGLAAESFCCVCRHSQPYLDHNARRGARPRQHPAQSRPHP